jgi:nucleoside phosphorylase
VVPGARVRPLTVATATRTETLAARWVLRGRAPVVRVGVACRRGGVETAGPLVVCGVAGGLVPELAPGAVVIPDEVAMGSEWTVTCDRELTERLREASRRLGLEPDAGPLVTLGSVVRGRERAAWAGSGAAAVDMESAILVRAARGPAAVVRVVLDTPWRELLRSVPWAVPYSLRAAAVVRELLVASRAPSP